MPKFRLNNFPGGLTDDFIDPADATTLEVADNIYIDYADNLVHREGFSQWITQTSGGLTPLGKIAVHDAQQTSNDSEPNSADLFYHYNDKVGGSPIYSRVTTPYTLDYDGGPSRSVLISGAYGTNIDGRRTSKSMDDLKTSSNSRKMKFSSVKTSIGNIFTFDSYSRPAFWNSTALPFVNGTTYLAVGLPAIGNFASGISNFAGSTNTYAYTWFAHYYYTYVLNGATFIVNGPVSQFQKVFETPMGVSGASQGISGDNLPVLGEYPGANGVGPGFINDVEVAIYRTEANSTTAYFVHSEQLSTTQATNWSYTDTDTDEDIVNNAPPTGLTATIYITGGVLDDDEPVSAKYCTYANDVVWMGNTEDFPQRVIYSKPRQPHSYPGSFFLDMPDTITGMSFIDIYPIVFTTSAVYRLEGITTETGVGQPIRRLVTDRMGTYCPHAIVKAEDKVFWLGTDGIYTTNGYTYAKLTTSYDDRLRTMLAPSNGDKGSSLAGITGTYNAVQKRIYFALQKQRDPGSEVPNVGFDNDIVLCLDLKGDKPRLTTYYGFVEQDPSLIGGIADPEFWYKPASIAAYDDFLLVGDVRGYGFIHERRLTTDVFLDTINSPAGVDFQKPVGTPCDIVTSAYSFGDESTLSWVSSIIVTCRNFFNAARTLTLDIFSINDTNRLDERALQGIAEERTDNKTHIVRRKFPAGHLRTQFKQIRFRSGLRELPFEEVSFPIIGANDGTMTTFGTNVVQVPGAQWKDDLVGCFLFTSLDDFATGRAIGIAAPGSDTMTLLDPIPDTETGVIYSIRRYPFEKFQLEAFELEYQPLGEAVTEYSGGGSTC